MVVWPDACLLREVLILLAAVESILGIFLACLGYWALWYCLKMIQYAIVRVVKLRIQRYRASVCDLRGTKRYFIHGETVVEGWYCCSYNLSSKVRFLGPVVADFIIWDQSKELFLKIIMVLRQLLFIVAL